MSFKEDQHRKARKCHRHHWKAFRTLIQNPSSEKKAQFALPLHVSDNPHLGEFVAASFSAGENQRAGRAAMAAIRRRAWRSSPRNQDSVRRQKRASSQHQLSMTGTGVAWSEKTTWQPAGNLNLDRKEKKAFWNQIFSRYEFSFKEGERATKWPF